jgi:hypothetical protein
LDRARLYRALAALAEIHDPRVQKTAARIGGAA